MSISSVSDDRLAMLTSADRVIVDGALNILRLPGNRRIVADHARGVQLFDVDGTVYTDYLLGSGPLVLGHAHPAVVEAVARQIPLGSTFYTLNRPAIELAERLVELVPCAELVRYCTTGSEATMFALRLARAATGRDAVLKFEGGFHGNNDYALMSLTPQRQIAFPTAQPSSDGIPAVLVPEVLIAPFNDIDVTRAIVEQHASRLAAIIVEPVQRAIPPVPGFLEGLRGLADRHGVVLIFDEVVTGFRLALGGAQELYGVTPDLATYGKILGGGFPLAAVAGRREIMESASGRTYVSGTLSGNPVAAAAGLATLAVLSEDGAFEHLHSLGARARVGIEHALGSNGHEACVIGVGPIFHISFREDPPLDYRQASDAAAEPLSRLTAHLLDSRIVFTGKKGYLSLAHTENDIDRLIELIAGWACANVA